ncbi:unnamed protein product [Staurois parvus]|uniref:Uncharacterized protein n=1 Tax=Staurois parvus TaxID=386267 RepID=A0ABN9C0X0_9NEOB|nr:unnamed protein product [Staurois parvus]
MPHISAHLSFLSVSPISQSVPPISAANQCHLSVPVLTISAAYQCPSVLPISAT